MARPSRFDPAHDQLIGTDSDQAIADRLGVTRSTVAARRVQLGVAAARARRIWTSQEDALLGRDTDASIAHKLGRSHASVTQRRIALGVPPVSLEQRRALRMRTRADVLAYLAGDIITCLICGRPCKSVGHHVRQAHGISAREYKQQFGLPLSRGIEAESVRQARSDAMRATRAAGRMPQTPPPVDAQRRGKSPYKMARVTAADVGRVMHRLQAGETLTEACAYPGMPSWSAVHSALHADEGLQARFDALVESLPFAQQARMKKLGARFAAACDALSDLTCKAAAQQLGVSDDVVRRHRVREKSLDGA